MTSSPSPVQRKIRQLENDVQSIYVMLAAIQGTQKRHTNRFGELADQLEVLRVRLDGHDQRFDEVDQRFDAVDTRLAGIERRLGGHDQRFDGLDGKLDAVLELLRARG